ncbi:hypothetical protein ONZ45_g6713 [Pleurotus djamor]|nr:hypothetical protein ONZ45_g6713 [Pleurotus djamor]
MYLPNLIKDAVVVATVLAFHWTATPPNPSVAKEEHQRQGLFERTIRYRVVIDKTLLWGVALMEIGSSFYKTSTGDQTHTISILPPVLVFGALLCILGSLLRVWCFKALGKMFDFQFRIHPDHQLITTGPYSYVRHPSYTGGFAMIIGATMVAFAPGSWMREFGLSYTATTIAGIYWCIEAVLMITMISRRMHAEDEGLEQNFGNEWDKFAARVPYRLIPSIY